MQSHEFLVLGAGLQGCCIALELARRGRQVTLLDQDPWPMNRASLRNEGKIHLGLIYAADASLATAELQLRGALHFWPLLRRWLGPAAERIAISTPFVYLVARDSLLGAEALLHHYRQLEQRCREQLRDPALDYLGQRPQALVEALPAAELGRHFNPAHIATAFRTEERAIDTAHLAEALRTAVAGEPRLRWLPGLRVEHLERSAHGMRVDCRDTDGAPHRLQAAQVVNACWEQRLHLDRLAGLEPAPGWLHRLKYRSIVALPPAMAAAPSATMVLGRYGDVVIRPDATAYLSWYPAGLQGWTQALRPPQEWQAPCRGDVPPVFAAELAARMIRSISAWYPGLEGSQLLTVDAGAILAYGRSDVDDPASGLHDRSRVGLAGDAVYLSVDPGKLTTAPLFACAAVDRLLGEGAGLEHARA